MPGTGSQHTIPRLIPAPVAAYLFSKDVQYKGATPAYRTGRQLQPNKSYNAWLIIITFK